jgi:NADPH:quinone reductase-like Zn-dependent oxidoreductase
MKGVICTKYGPPEVLKIMEIDKPTPKENEILIKILSTSVTIADSRVRGFNVPLSFWLPARMALGFRKPRKSILGMELSGVIESVGNNVKLYKQGDRIFANTGHNCFGAYAEYCCMPESGNIAIKPENISFEEAAAITFGGITALQFLRKGNIKQGDKVLIYGASGSIGTYAIQLAKYFGAEVTGVCSTGNLEMVKSLGADKVIDYTTTDFSKSGQNYDVIFDTVGKASISGTIRSLKSTGIYIHAVTSPATEIIIRLSLLTSKKKLIGGTFTPNNEQINFLKKLIEERKIRPIIDRRYSLDQIIEAHRYVDLGHKRGNVVITINQNE